MKSKLSALFHKAMGVLLPIGAAVILCVIVTMSFTGAFSVHAQPNDYLFPQPSSYTYSRTTIPGQLPTSLTCVVGKSASCQQQITTEAYLCAYDIIATGQTAIIQDGQGTPIPFISGVLGVGGAPATNGFAWPDSLCRWMPGGVYWQQTGGPGATGRLVIKFSR